MAVEYAPKGLVGVLTPQANTTVEPEFAILLPPGYAMINARMTSDCATLSQRMVDYIDTLDGSLRQFHNAPVDAVAFACTGASYLIGPDREDAIATRQSERLGVPFVTAGKAVMAGLDALGAKRVGLVSPYPAELTQAAVSYWEARGCEVAAVASADLDDTQFHPIYSIRAGTVSEALASLDGRDLDAVVMLGTGMPTLGTILARPHIGRAPVFSCMLALAWATVGAIARRPPSADDLRDWIAGSGWRRRYAERLGG